MSQLEEYQTIEIAIELDKGRSIESVAEQFEVSRQTIRKLANTASLSKPRKKKTAKKKPSLTQEDREKIIDLVMEGDELEDIALDFDISINTIHKLCRENKVTIPRSSHQLTKTEVQEIRALLDEGESPEEIALAYQVKISSLDDLQMEYKKLDFTSLGVLYEILSENPNASPAKIRNLTKKEGFVIPESVIVSYQNRLKKLNSS